MSKAPTTISLCICDVQNGINNHCWLLYYLQFVKLHFHARVQASRIRQYKIIAAILPNYRNNCARLRHGTEQSVSFMLKNLSFRY